MENKFLYYNYLPLLASHFLDIPYQSYRNVGIIPKHNYRPFNPIEIKEKEIIFVKTNLLEYFFQNCFQKIKFNFYLVTGVSDDPINERYLNFLNNTKIIKWFGHNIILSHPKVVKIPIGFDENERRKGGPATGEGGDQILLKSLYESKKDFNNKKSKLLMTHIGITHKTRKDIIENMKHKNFVHVVGKSDFKTYMNTINDYKFILCPRGNGEDTHRFWEVCLMGSVPVVEKNGLLDLFENVPCIIVDSFDNVSEELLSNFYYDKEKESNAEKYLLIEKFEEYFTEKLK